MKRILYVEANEDGTIGGSHKIQADLVTRLSPAFEPVVIYYQHNPWVDRLLAEGIEVHVWEDVRRAEMDVVHSGGKLATLRALAGAVRLRRRFLREHRIDLVHLNNSPFVGVDDWLPAARSLGVPCTAYAMGYVTDDRASWRQVLVRRYDAVFPLSRYMAAYLDDHRIPSERVVLTYPGIDLDPRAGRRFRSREDVRDEFGVSDDRLLALMVGNLREWKGQHVVAEAVRHLSPALRERVVVLLVGGHGPEEESYVGRIEEMIAEGGLGEVVRMVGLRDDVPDLMEAADICIHASVRPEPFGLVVQEAMLHRCAVIAANEGGPVELLTPESGLTFDPACPQQLTGHLALLLSDDEARLRYADQARRRIREFDVHRHVELVESTYARLLA